jgi:hypothetical protein
MKIIGFRPRMLAATISGLREATLIYVNAATKKV